MTAADRSFETFAVGETASFERIITADDVHAFAMLSGDQNPLHLDEAYAATTRFGKPIAHGMLLASFFSALLGMQLPGKRCLYLSQTLQFRSPAGIGDALTVAGVVSRVSEGTRTLELELSIRRGETVLVTGTALVQVL